MIVDNYLDACDFFDNIFVIFHFVKGMDDLCDE